jgi:glucose-1-phosphate cytidylyltransferase
LSEPWKVTLIDTGLYTDTAGRIARIQRFIGDEMFGLTYGDGVSDIDLNKLRDTHLKNGSILTLTAIQPGGRFGVLNLDSESDQVSGFLEKAPEAAGWINAGFMMVNPSIFDYITGDDCSLEKTVLPVLAANKQLSAFKHYKFWQCMDTQRDKIVLEDLWKTGSAPWKVWG